ncbi:hypothetical protein P280DRAFT_523579 [Massarina eburnea CBS 473.64]|uniref:Uncharacterized protein n=1 Tax=Massarina eburnea CBS 473.64 TaxID=1395130 RepID=A0A6A6RLK3_9PLEO|nr:hypothetical protein P280DRAFT_523579 [Massarina eburnea CBS 473.64]
MARFSVFLMSKKKSSSPTTLEIDTGNQTDKLSHSPEAPKSLSITPKEDTDTGPKRRRNFGLLNLFNFKAKLSPTPSESSADHTIVTNLSASSAASSSLHSLSKLLAVIEPQVAGQKMIPSLAFIGISNTELNNFLKELAIYLYGLENGAKKMVIPLLPTFGRGTFLQITGPEAESTPPHSRTEAFHDSASLSVSTNFPPSSITSPVEPMLLCNQLRYGTPTFTPSYPRLRYPPLPQQLVNTKPMLPYKTAEAFGWTLFDIEDVFNTKNFSDKIFCPKDVGEVVVGFFGTSEKHLLRLLGNNWNGIENVRWSRDIINALAAGEWFCSNDQKPQGQEQRAQHDSVSCACKTKARRVVVCCMPSSAVDQTGDGLKVKNAFMVLPLRIESWAWGLVDVKDGMKGLEKQRQRVVKFAEWVRKDAVDRGRGWK